MSQLMPELLATWTWRLERVQSGRTMLGRGQARTARTDLMHDRAAHPEAYAGYEEEFAAAIDALDVLAQQHNRRDDLDAVLASERRRERAAAGAVGADHRSAGDHATHGAARSRASLAPEHDRVPRGLPEPLDQWVHRLIRYRSGAKLIAPIEASRAEIRLRNEADLDPAAYLGPVSGPYFRRVMRELGEIATSQRPGVHLAGRGLHRGVPTLPSDMASASRRSAR
jgi:hypothetical protein